MTSDINPIEKKIVVVDNARRYFEMIQAKYDGQVTHLPGFDQAYVKFRKGQVQPDLLVTEFADVDSSCKSTLSDIINSVRSFGKKYVPVIVNSQHTYLSYMKKECNNLGIDYLIWKRYPEPLFLAVDELLRYPELYKGKEVQVRDQKTVAARSTGRADLNYWATRNRLRNRWRSPFPV